MSSLNREDLEARYHLFQQFALNDQRKYYRKSVKRYRGATRQVNQLRAVLALITGLASALTILIVSVEPDCRTRGISSVVFSVQDGAAANDATDGAAPTPEAGAANDAASTLDAQGTNGAAPGATAEFAGNCAQYRGLLMFLLIIAVVAPALGGAFSTLADLYQWDRLINVYDSALENLEVADAKSPLPEMDEIRYRAGLKAYSAGVLSVMRDETAQWGQLIKTPEQLQRFIEREIQASAKTADVVPTLQSLQVTFKDELASVRDMLAQNEKRLEELRDQFKADATGTPPASPPAGGASDPADPEPGSGGG